MDRQRRLVSRLETDGGKVSRRGVMALFAIAMAAGLLSSSVVETADATLRGTTPDATFAGRNGRIAYMKASDGGRDIFTVRPDGSGRERLTFSGNAGKPIWSPLGGRIAFERAGAVWVMRADGFGKQQLLDGQLVGWMPGGDRILVVRNLHHDPYSG